MTYSVLLESNTLELRAAANSCLQNATIPSFGDIAHELRQPLSIIESLAYYLELTSKDESACVHLRKIQAMVLQANYILSDACSQHTIS